MVGDLYAIRTPEAWVAWYGVRFFDGDLLLEVEPRLAFGKRQSWFLSIDNGRVVPLMDGVASVLKLEKQ